MKKQAFRIVRRYRKCFAILATKRPNSAFLYWNIYHNKLDGLMDMLAADSNISYKEYMLMNKYFEKKFQELYRIYCK